MSKYILEDDFIEEDFQVIGITCHALDFRLSWAINKELSISLSKEKEVLLETKKAGTASFSNYFFENDELSQGYRLLKNKYNKQMLLPEQKPADYLLIMYGDVMVNEVLNSLRNINIVLMCFEINVSTLKNKQNLLF